MPISGVEIDGLATSYEAGARNVPWRGHAVQGELAVLQLRYPLAAISSHMDLEDHLLGKVTPQVQARGAFTAAELLLVASWKSDRTVSCVGINERVPGALTALTTAALATGLSTTERVRALRKIHGVGVRLASAILMVWNPDEYTVLDRRALHTLGSFDESASGTAFGGRAGDWWDRHYDGYRLGCKAIAAREARDLRSLDRALWRWSFEN